MVRLDLLIYFSDMYDTLIKYLIKYKQIFNNIPNTELSNTTNKPSFNNTGIDSLKIILQWFENIVFPIFFTKYKTYSKTPVISIMLAPSISSPFYQT